VTVAAPSAREARAGGGRRRWRALPWLVVTLVLLVILVVAGRPQPGTPLDPRSTRPDGTRALVLLLETYGRVDITDRVPGPQPNQRVLVLDDRLRDRQRTELLDWVEAGGVLVVADPDSSLHV
jgi:hypothetical protein